MTTNYFFETKEHYFAFRDAWKKAVNSGVKLTAAHFILYNIIRDKDPQYGFTPYQRLSKMKGMGILNNGYYQATLDLNRFKIRETQAEMFIAPFLGTLTYDQLINAIQLLNDSSPTALWTYYGKGKKVFDMIQKGEIKPKTCIELMDYCKEVYQEVA